MSRPTSGIPPTSDLTSSPGVTSGTSPLVEPECVRDSGSRSRRTNRNSGGQDPDSSDDSDYDSDATTCSSDCELGVNPLFFKILKAQKRTKDGQLEFFNNSDTTLYGPSGGPSGNSSFAGTVGSTTTRTMAPTNKITMTNTKNNKVSPVASYNGSLNNPNLSFNGSGHSNNSSSGLSTRGLFQSSNKFPGIPQPPPLPTPASDLQTSSALVGYSSGSDESVCSSSNEDSFCRLRTISRESEKERKDLITGDTYLTKVVEVEEMVSVRHRAQSVLPNVDNIEGPPTSHSDSPATSLSQSDKKENSSHNGTPSQSFETLEAAGSKKDSKNSLPNTNSIENHYNDTACTANNDATHGDKTLEDINQKILGAFLSSFNTSVSNSSGNNSLNLGTVNALHAAHGDGDNGARNKAHLASGGSLNEGTKIDHDKNIFNRQNAFDAVLGRAHVNIVNIANLSNKEKNVTNIDIDGPKNMYMHAAGNVHTRRFDPLSEETYDFNTSSSFMPSNNAGSGDPFSDDCAPINQSGEYMNMTKVGSRVASPTPQDLSIDHVDRDIIVHDTVKASTSCTPSIPIAVKTETKVHCASVPASPICFAQPEPVGLSQDNRDINSPLPSAAALSSCELEGSGHSNNNNTNSEGVRVMRLEELLNKSFGNNNASFNQNKSVRSNNSNNGEHTNPEIHSMNFSVSRNSGDGNSISSSNAVPTKSPVPTFTTPVTAAPAAIPVSYLNSSVHSNHGSNPRSPAGPTAAPRMEGSGCSDGGRFLCHGVEVPLVRAVSVSAIGGADGTDLLTSGPRAVRSGSFIPTTAGLPQQPSPGSFCGRSSFADDGNVMYGSFNSNNGCHSVSSNPLDPAGSDL